ncbi:MAG: hypothetical protein AAB370_11055 [Verrucomicrobiota bacterium]
MEPQRQELTPQQKSQAESAETMVPKALLQGRSAEAIIEDLVRLDWEPQAAQAFVKRVMQDVQRYFASSESRAALVKECRQEFVTGMIVACLSILMSVSSFFLMVTGVLYVWILAGGATIFGLVRMNRGYSRWRLYGRFPLSLPVDSQIEAHSNTPPVRSEKKPILVRAICMAAVVGVALFILVTLSKRANQIGLGNHVSKTDVFLEAGIPSAEREWRGTDYKVAAEIFWAQKAPLPHFAHSKGAALVRRMTSLENLSFHRNRSLPISVRMEDYLLLIEGVSSIVEAYVKVANQGRDVPQETAGMVALLLEVGALGIELTEEFLPTLPLDEKYAIRIAGVKKMQAGFVGMFAGAELSLAERKFYQPDDLSTLLEAMANTLPRLKPVFPVDFQIEMRRRLEAHLGEFNRPEDSRRINRMLKELEN